MDIVGSVAVDEVPTGRSRMPREGVWTGLARRAVDDHKQERVTVVRLKDEEELKKMRNGIGLQLRTLGYTARPVIVDADDELRVFLELNAITTNGSVSDTP